MAPLVLINEIDHILIFGELSRSLKVRNTSFDARICTRVKKTRHNLSMTHLLDKDLMRERDARGDAN